MSITGYCILVWSRDDRGEEIPTDIIVVETKDLLKDALIKYLSDNSYKDDEFLEDDEKPEIYEEAIQGILDETNLYPELNSIYVTEIKSNIEIYLNKNYVG